MKKLYPLRITKNFLVVVFLLVFQGILTANAQEVISSGGASGISSTHQLSWTIGEPVIETHISGSTILTQGFQQSNLTITAIDLITGSGITLKVYPNPVPDLLIIEKICDVSQNINIRLFDISGKLLLEQCFEDNLETLNMQVFRSGNYFLKVYSANNAPLQSFKIIKN